MQQDPEEEEGERERRARFILDLRAKGLQDTRVLAAMEKVPRELFVAEELSDQAYEDRALPIDCGQTISQPFVVAYMTEQLAVDDRMKVLEIGTGSGYQTAVLAHLARRVYSIERYQTLAREAEARLAQLRLSNVTVIVGDGNEGWPPQAPFDRIIVTAAAPTVPTPLLQQLLRVGGVMVLPVGASGGLQHLRRIERTPDGVRDAELIEVRFVPLVPGRARQL